MVVSALGERSLLPGVDLMVAEEVMAGACGLRLTTPLIRCFT